MASPNKKKGKKAGTAASASTVQANAMDAMTSTLAHTTLSDSSPQTPQHDILNRRNIAGEFNRYFGNVSRVDNWQRLCRDVGIQDDLPSVKKCREALKGVWINIYDLLEAVRDNNCPPKRFATQKALARYTIKEGKIYPKRKAKNQGPVKALLTHIF